MDYYIGADLGTSSLKLILINENGNVVKSLTKDYDLYFPKPGWSEQNPDDWWNAFCHGTKELCENYDIKDVKTISFAGQMHGLVILDENDNIIRPAILWNDGRCSKQTDYLNNIIGKETLAKETANIAFAGFTLPKLLWLKENEPQNFSRISKIMLPKDYMVYRLTGVHSTDFSDASGTLFLDVKNKCWSKKMLDICSISQSWLPKLFESYDKVGEICEKASSECGLGTHTIVSAGAGDNAGAAIGTKTVGEGGCNISLGTSGTVFVSSKKYLELSNNAVHSFCHADGGYHIMGCILSAASCVKWFCENILKTNDIASEQEKITSDSLGKNNIFFLPYLMGERSPINDTDARGTFVGMMPDSSRCQMLLAVMEGVAFAIRDSVEIAAGSNVHLSSSTVCGGGARSKLWLTILANVLNIEIRVPEIEEGPGYGAALLAMSCHTGKDVKALSEGFFKTKFTINPSSELVGDYNQKYEKFKQIYPNMKSVFKILSKE